MDDTGSPDDPQRSGGLARRHPRPSPRVVWPELRDTALSAINGAIGDYLQERGNGLALDMELRHGRQPLPLEREAIARAHPDATPKICVLIHGLAMSDTHWRIRSEQRYGAPGIDFGIRLQQELGYTPFYVRYNTGLHISENGRQLADLLEQLTQAYPVDLDEILLLGHSMGGLVARSAAHRAHEEGQQWIDRLRRLICLGSPHLGAPLEKAAHVTASALRAIPNEVTRVIGEIVDGRSRGIKDLRFGYVTDESWRQGDLDAFLKNSRHDAPLVPEVEYGFFASTVTRDPNHPVGWLLGDVMVRVPSATARGGLIDDSPTLRHAEWYRLGRIGHIELIDHPEVYTHIKHWLMTRDQGQDAM